MTQTTNFKEEKNTLTFVSNSYKNKKEKKNKSYTRMRKIIESNRYKL